MTAPDRTPRARRPRLAALVHLATSGAVVTAGAAHIVSIHGKATAGTLASVSDLALGTLYGIGVIIVATGLAGVATWPQLWRHRRALGARLAALGGLLVLLTIVVAFREPRGLPLLAAPLLDLAFLVPLRERPPTPG